MIRALADAVDSAAFGGKAVQLGAAVRAGLPVPAGFAVSFDQVDATARGDTAAATGLKTACAAIIGCVDRPRAVRSSAVGEDSRTASFAGAHESVLGVCDFDAIVRAIRRVHASARVPAALAYRVGLGLDRACRMAVVVQELVDAEVAGVLFTRNPVTGAVERVIEASWGLGEAVVSGLVTPDRYRLDPAGRLLERQLGDKDVAIRRGGGGGTVQVPVAPELAGTPCLDKEGLTALNALAAACDQVYDSPDHDIEFAFRGGAVFLLQRRPITGR
jgi:pyruvate,water dikinase